MASIANWSDFEGADWTDPDERDSRYMEAVILAFNEHSDMVYKKTHSYGGAYAYFPDIDGSYQWRQTTEPISYSILNNNKYFNKSVLKHIGLKIAYLLPYYMNLNPYGNNDCLRVYVPRTADLVDTSPFNKGDQIIPRCIEISGDFVEGDSWVNLPFDGGVIEIVDQTVTINYTSDWYYIDGVVGADHNYIISNPVRHRLTLNYPELKYETFGNLTQPRTWQFMGWTLDDMLNHIEAEKAEWLCDPIDPKKWLIQMYKIINAMTIVNQTASNTSTYTSEDTVLLNESYAINTNYGWNGLRFSGHGLNVKITIHGARQEFWGMVYGDFSIEYRYKTDYKVSLLGTGLFADTTTEFTYNAGCVQYINAYWVMPNSNNVKYADYNSEDGAIDSFVQFSLTGTQTESPVTVKTIGDISGVPSEGTTLWYQWGTVLTPPDNPPDEPNRAYGAGWDTAEPVWDTEYGNERNYMSATLPDMTEDFNFKEEA